MPTQAQRILPIGIGLLLIVATGVIHGIQTDRWGESTKVLEAARRLDQLPTEFGDWSGTASEIPEKQLKVAEAVGHYSQKFTNTKDGRELSVMILCGRPGPISVHPPTVCFVGAGWGLQTTPAPVEFESPDAGSMWKGRFARVADGVPIAIETHWGWSADGKWMALDRPRLETAQYPYLYKMYVTVPFSNASEGDVKTTTDEFMESFLPLLNEALFQNSPPDS
ncbi:exosortase-associated EpsI family protein [Thalassoglobus sp.]|uniref:exosortase-associated EpsI family protein n=1 Tax=Thalassoglobus sp. TaxID=2795869 RepID=UPI003AA8938B